MSENAYHDLWVEIMMALQSSLSAGKPPRRKTDWKHMRQVVDPKGNVLGQIKSSRRHMSVIPSQVAGAGERLVRLKNQGWLVEAERVPKGLTRRSVLITEAEAEQWLSRNGWTPVKGGSKAEPTRYAVQGDEAVLVMSGYAIVSGPPETEIAVVNDAHVTCEGPEAPVTDLDDPDLEQASGESEGQTEVDDGTETKTSEDAAEFGPEAESAEALAGIDPAGVNVVEDLLVVQTTTQA